jgi:hemerythrin-like domain-containing protein
MPTRSAICDEIAVNVDVQSSRSKAGLFASSSPAQGENAMIDERPTARFRAEHKEVGEHLRHVHEWVGALSTQQAAEQRKTAQRVAAFFEEHIKPHAAWEERFLYPVVDKLAGRGPNAFTSTMRYEHRVVGRWIGELRAEADKERIDAELFSRRTDNLLGLLWAHFEEEEEVLLPFIEKEISKEQFERELGPGADAHE